MPEDEWVRTPRQARSQATLHRFIQSTRELLQERPFEDITVAHIVAKAERTVGSFYARFEDKYSVLHVLADELDQQVRVLVEDLCEQCRRRDASVSEFVSAWVEMSVGAYRRAGAVGRAALTAAATDARFRSCRLDSLRFCGERHQAYLLARRHEIPRPDAARAADQVYETIIATLDHELLFGRFTATSPPSDLELVAELTDQCLAVLGLATRQPQPLGV